MKRLFFYPILFAIILLYCCQPAWAEFDKSFLTKYSTIYYTQDKDIDDFIWRLGGQKLEFATDRNLASSRIDRLIKRTQMILDMWPKDFKVNIYLHRGVLQPNRVAFHDSKSNSLHICVDYASDGVVAHELAHAIIDQYFPLSTPTKMQEILAQYVDRHLWSDY
ncbi:MAG: hypothetical protein JW734_10125 [Candidatus Omnitrophica bacterium]|nr:hypothetical protein [Candidatus Omnitrophota bacterium]